ncbi:MAG: hypothetical protein ACREM1_24140 [Longimicrobiales bacterium]
MQAALPLAAVSALSEGERPSREFFAAQDAATQDNAFPAVLLRRKEFEESYIREARHDARARASSRLPWRARLGRVTVT